MTVVKRASLLPELVPPDEVEKAGPLVVGYNYLKRHTQTIVCVAAAVVIALRIVSN